MSEIIAKMQVMSLNCKLKKITKSDIFTSYWWPCLVKLNELFINNYTVYYGNKWKEKKNEFLCILLSILQCFSTVLVMLLGSRKRAQSCLLFIELEERKHHTKLHTQLINNRSYYGSCLVNNSGNELDRVHKMETRFISLTGSVCTVTLSRL